MSGKRVRPGDVPGYRPRVHVYPHPGSHAWDVVCWECCNDMTPQEPCEDDTHWRRGSGAIGFNRCPWCDGTGSPNEKAQAALRGDSRKGGGA